MELQYRKLKCGKYKYETTQDFKIKTQCNDVKCNKYLWIKNGWLYIKRGYRWDGSSGPAIDTAKCMIASLVHDAYYQMMREECILRDAWRGYADRQYRDICLDAGMWEPMAEWRYWAIVKYAGKYTHPQPEKRGKVFTIKSGYGKTTRKVSRAAGFLLAVCLLIGAGGAAGCVHVDIEGVGSVTTLFKNIDADEIYIEGPNTNYVAWLVKYRGESKNAKLKVNPLTRSLEAAVSDDSVINSH